MDPAMADVCEFMTHETFNSLIGTHWLMLFCLCISWLHGDESHGDEDPYPNRRP